MCVASYTLLPLPCPITIPDNCNSGISTTNCVAQMLLSRAQDTRRPCGVQLPDFASTRPERRLSGSTRRCSLETQAVLQTIAIHYASSRNRLQADHCRRHQGLLCPLSWVQGLRSSAKAGGLHERKNFSASLHICNMLLYWRPLQTGTVRLGPCKVEQVLQQTPPTN